MKYVFTLFLIASIYCPCFSQNDSSFIAVDSNPQFKGGNAKYGEYLKSFRCPKSVVRNKYEGKAYAIFSVEKDGSITLEDIDLSSMIFFKSNIDEVKQASIKQDLISEIERFFKEMPAWIPGLIKDEPVRVRYKLNFVI